MSKEPLFPARKRILEVYIKCLKRAERRIIIGAKRRNGNPIDVAKFHRQRPLILHIESCYSESRRCSFMTALMALRVKRSKLQAELEGLKWRM